MNRGFTLPILILIIVLLIAIPAVFWVTTSEGKDIKGASSQEVTIQRGFSVFIESQDGTWDLIEYLCTDKEECVEGLDSGESWGTVSGGKTDHHEVLVSYSSAWDTYEYLKVFVRPAWHESTRTFGIKDKSIFEGGEIVEISNNGKKIEVLLIPLDLVRDSFVRTVVFSDVK